MMPHSVNNLDNTELFVYIDKYLDRLLSEDETDEFEAKCLEDKNFFQIVQERERLRQTVTNVVRENGREIFAEYLTGDRKKRTVDLREGALERLKHFWLELKPAWRFSLIPAGVFAAFVILLMLRIDPYQPDPAMEGLIGAVRGGTSITIISPENETAFDGPVQFTWENGDQKPLQYILLDNRGNEIKKITTGQVAYSYTANLEPGLYYWKLIKGDQVIVQKFTVGKK
jgi:hypothetical protein